MHNLNDLLLSEPVRQTNMDQKENPATEGFRIPDFPENQKTETLKTFRREKSKNDFWYWFGTYCPHITFADYAGKEKFYNQNKTDRTTAKADLIANPAILKMEFIYCFLFAKYQFMGFYSGNLKTSQEFMLEIFSFLFTNKRIQYDYFMQWGKLGSNGLQLLSDVSKNHDGCIAEPISGQYNNTGNDKITSRYNLVININYENM